MTEQELQQLRDSLAKYMGFVRDSDGLEIMRKYRHEGGKGFICYVKDWKPDENSEQADMVEDKLLEMNIFRVTCMIRYSDNEYQYKLMLDLVHVLLSCKAESKKLARALALNEAVIKIVMK